MLLIFDCDGVLRSLSWEKIMKAYGAIIRFMGKEPEEFFQDNLESFKKWFDPNWQINMENIGNVTENHYPDIVRIFHAIHDPYVVVFPWVEKVLNELSRRHTITVLSASSVKSVKQSLIVCNQCVSCVVGAEDVKKVKPDTEGVEFIMRKFEAKHSETLIIGDAEPDIWAGQNAGIKTGAVGWGIRSAEELARLNPDFIFHSPEELLLIK